MSVWFPCVWKCQCGAVLFVPIHIWKWNCMYELLITFSPVTHGIIRPSPTPSFFFKKFWLTTRIIWLPRTIAPIKNFCLWHQLLNHYIYPKPMVPSLHNNQNFFDSFIKSVLPQFRFCENKIKKVSLDLLMYLVVELNIELPFGRAISESTCQWLWHILDINGWWVYSAIFVDNSDLMRRCRDQVIRQWELFIYKLHSVTEP